MDHGRIMGTPLRRASLRLSLQLFVAALILTLFTPVSTHSHAPEAILPIPAITSCPRASTIDVDPLNPPLRKRTESDDDDATKSSKPTSTTVVPSSSSSQLTIVRPSMSDPVLSSDIIRATPSVPEAPLPTAFDTNIANDSFTTESCATFFKEFTTNSAFIQCYPVSILIGSSKSWFNAAKSFVSITRVLDASCSVDVARCTNLLAQLGKEISTKEICGQELANNNPLVLSARNGFVAYRYMYDAACLKNPDMGSYCLADALSSEETTGNTFVYHLALGTSLPGGSRPVCNKCLQATMEVYSRGAGFKEQPLSQTYKQAAQQINIGCGPGFVSESVPNAASVSASLPLRALSYLTVPLLAYLILHMS
ncbi:predicted protein [Uncinocarpus reesii 1704]|uniref:DUF7729 domain-containing protein n=1 Tax=Uncinocarpus reesii (strain UAMH 1704) TaxID=336963 RepID=C4JVY7_UNCRE|nr:uncharacterized protein UREG_06729 [Uncinocarpus reesii 1704]EEP81864.1 predicted protein [Uncinocarpus reesii 1704]